MKKIYLLLLPFYLFGNIDNDGLYRLSSEIKNEDLNASAKIELENNKPKYRILNLSSIQKIDQLKLNRKMSLVAEANLELHHKLNLYRAMKKLEYEAEAREIALAQSWQNSKTGRVDGRSWFNLYEEEKRVYRKLYYEFYNHKK
jgi:hypothetical protein